jgi:hypothetical protein
LNSHFNTEHYRKVGKKEPEGMRPYILQVRRHLAMLRDQQAAAELEPVPVPLVAVLEDPLEEPEAREERLADEDYEEDAEEYGAEVYRLIMVHEPHLILEGDDEDPI